MRASFLSDRGPHSTGQRRCLPQVTLVAVSSVALDATVNALRKSLAQVKFGAALLLSDRLPQSELGPELAWRKISPIRSRNEYSHFMLYDLHRHIETDFALCIQWDGYILDARQWTAEFLQFDYIGAPWPHLPKEANVGNGGFSLRSKRLIEACAKLPVINQEAEDITICREYRSHLEEAYSIRFAPEALAKRFSYERIPRNGNEFGFHGVFNLIKHIERSEFQALLKSLEPNMLGTMEWKELLFTALRLRRAEVARRAAISIFRRYRDRMASNR